MLFAISIADCGFVAIDALQCILVVQKLVVVLFVDGVFLGFDLVANQYLFIVLLFLAIALLFLSSSHFVPHGQLLESQSFLLLNCLLFSDVLVFHAPAIGLMHQPLLLESSSSFLLGSFFSLVAELQILPAEFMLVVVIFGPHCLHLFVHVLVVSNRILQLLSLG